MQSLTLDRDLPGKLNGLQQHVEITDEQGKTLGVYVPMEAFDDFVRSVQVPFSIEEIERRRKEKGGSSLAEFWQRMETKCHTQ